MRRCSERMPEPADLIKPLARPGRNLLDHICCTALDHSVHLQKHTCNCNEHRNLSAAQDPTTCVHARTLASLLTSRERLQGYRSNRGEQRGQDEFTLKRRRVDAARHAQARAGTRGSRTACLSAYATLPCEPGAFRCRSGRRRRRPESVVTKPLARASATQRNCPWARAHCQVSTHPPPPPALPY